MKATKMYIIMEKCSHELAKLPSLFPVFFLFLINYKIGSTMTHDVAYRTLLVMFWFLHFILWTLIEVYIFSRARLPNLQSWE